MTHPNRGQGMPSVGVCHILFFVRQLEVFCWWPLWRVFWQWKIDTLFKAPCKHMQLSKHNDKCASFGNVFIKIIHVYVRRVFLLPLEIFQDYLSSSFSKSFSPLIANQTLTNEITNTLIEKRNLTRTWNWHLESFT